MKEKEINSTAIISELLHLILKNKLSRNLLQPQLDKYVRERISNNNTSKFPEFINQYEYNTIQAMYTSYFRNYDKGLISPKVSKKVLKTLVESAMIGDKECMKSIEVFKNKYGQLPPNFITISPTKKCNLNCSGCYATSNVTDSETLTWSLLNKIIEDSYYNMGMRFFVISGGEPLLYKSENKTILDLAHKWNDCFFLMYTNGTLINEETAKRMASLGNIIPAISIEGFATHTDNRRGSNTYQKIFWAKNNLIRNGVPFGLSVTATKENIDLLIGEEFYDYYFNNFCATFMWVFQYMPIGRNFTTDLMITPEQRVELFKTQNKLLIEKKLFIADFWNSAITSAGCISCGKPKGYFYINWDGNIMPCVFVPYYIDNVNSLFSSGKTLSDALFSPLFVEGRKWQSQYLHGDDKLGNLLMPCLYRDHYKDFSKIAKNTKAKPENQAAGDALNSCEYYKEMLSFNDKLEILSSPVWEEISRTPEMSMSEKK